MIENKNIKILMIVLIVLNTLLSFTLVVRQSPESLEVMKAWWKENYAIMEQIYSSETFKTQQKTSLEQALSQMKWTTDTANTTDTNTDDTATVDNSVVKSDKPEVSLFVMSYCPYWTQAQKWILDVMKRFGNKADIKIKFVHYLMHGKQEAEENVRQYCIQSEQNEKYTSYLECFLKAWEFEKCLTETNINKKKLDSCYKDIYAKYDIEKNLAEWWSYPLFGVDAEESKAAWVQWSPTLVINWKIVQSWRSANDYKNAICNAFNEKPAICDEEFISTSYDPMFGFTSNWNTVDWGCGS